MAIDPVTLPSAQRVRRWQTYLILWKCHRWVGLAFGALLVLMSVTGSLLVLHHDLERLAEPALHVAAAGSGAKPLSDLARAVAPLAPAGYGLFRLEPAETADATHKFLFRGPDGTTRWSAFVAPATGEILWHGPDQELLSPWLLQLHMQLRSGRPGYFVTGFTGLALLVLGISGLYLYRDRFSALWRHPFRLRLGWRVAFTDLHKWTGIAALYFILILSVTGALYVLAGLKVKPSATPPPLFNPASLAPLEPMLAIARDRLPGTEVLRVQFPTKVGAPLTLLLLHRDAPVWRKFSRVDFDPASGALRAVKAGAEAPANEQFASMLAPLHFGFYGATWVKWAYFFGGLSPALLAVSGFLIWRLRNKNSGPPSVSLA